MSVHIQLVMCPSQAPVTWDDFVEMEDKYAIAIDGYCIGGPRFDPIKCIANFNHHEQVDRLATRATCAQVLMAVRQGLFRTFRRHGVPYATVLANDCDEDVCTSWYVLKHHAFCEQPMNPLLNRLVMMEDALDATAGAYPFPQDLPVLRELAWVFEPYRQFRLSGGLDKKNVRAYESVVEDVEGRIGRHITGQGKEIPLDTSYERIGGGNGWVMVKETGAQARTGMFSDGIKAFVSVRELGNGRWAYVIGRLSNYIMFDLPRLYGRLDEAEVQHRNHDEQSPGDHWGGSDTIGGSPRVGASRIPPSVMEDIISQEMGG